MAKKVADDWLGINIPEPPTMDAAPAATQGDGTNQDNDAAAASNAKRRLEEERLRRGRSSVRIDPTSQTGGAGVAIAK